MFKMFALCFIFLVFACGTPPRESRQSISHQGDPTLGGDIARDHPLVKSTVHIRMSYPNANEEGYCAGVITGPHTIITVAHCLQGAKDIYVGFSAKTPIGPSDFLKATSFAPHPNYAPSNSYDVGLVQVPHLLNGYGPMETIWDDTTLLEDPERFWNNINSDHSQTLRSSFSPGSSEVFLQLGWGQTGHNSLSLQFLIMNFFSTQDSFVRTLYPPPWSTATSGDSGGPIILMTSSNSPLKSLCTGTTGGQVGLCLFGIHSRRAPRTGYTSVVSNLPSLAQSAGWNLKK